jgi:CRISPR-associated protein Cas1
MVPFAEFAWHRISAVLENTHVGDRGTAHPFTVFEAIVKGVSHRCGGVPPGGTVFFHLPGQRHTFALRKGSRVPLEVFFCGVEPGWAARWAAELPAHFEPRGGGRNFEVATVGPVEARSYDALEAESAGLSDEGELCLEFLSPVRVEKVDGKPREYLTPQGLAELLRKRLAQLTNVAMMPLPVSELLKVIPCYWNYVEIRHPSRSQAGHTQYVNGCVGKLYLKGPLGPLKPLLVLGSELHAGTKNSNSQGYYRILPPGTPYFAPVFPNRFGLAAACRDVLEHHDGAAAQLVDGPGVAVDEDALAATLSEEIRAGTYTPTPATAFSVRKNDGTERRVEQLHPRDLMVQKYLLATMGRVFDRLFEEGSIGYRKGGSRQRAARRIERAISDGFGYVVESDVEDYFPSVDLDRLEALLDDLLPVGDTALRSVVHRSLRSGYVLHGTLCGRPRGLAQGNPLSALMANLYLDAFDEAVSVPDVRLVRYVDDFVLLTRTREAAERMLGEAEACLAAWGLGLNAAKTAVKRVDEGFEFLGIRFQGGEARDKHEAEGRSYRKPLYVTTPYVFVGLDGETIDIRRQGSRLQAVPLRRVSELVILGKVAFSSALLGRCARGKIPVTLASGSGYYMTTVKPDSKRFYEVSHRHALKHNGITDTEKLVIAKGFAVGKLGAYQMFFKARYKKGAAAVARELEGDAESIRQSATVDQVRGYEAAAAKKVYGWLNGMIADPTFHLKRRKRTEPDRINSLLNFAYYLLFCLVNSTVRVQGLNPYLGFLHSDRNDYESLTCDIEELFRARIDRLVVRLLNWKTIQPDDFVKTHKGYWLKHEASNRFVQHFEAEMTRKDKANEMSLRESIYGQVEAVKRWVLGEGSLEFAKD